MMYDIGNVEAISSGNIPGKLHDDSGTHDYLDACPSSEKSATEQGIYTRWKVSSTKHNLVQNAQYYNNLITFRRKPWLRYFQDQLYNLRSIPDNWNGYGSAAPNSIAIRYAQDILDILYENDFPPEKISPSSEEGVALFLKKGKIHTFIECYNDGNIIAIQYENSGPPKISDIGSSMTEIREALDYIFGFSNG